VKGIGQFLKRPRIFSAIAILGAIFLMYMAWENFSSSGIPGQPDNPSADKHRLPDPVSGMVLSLTNPYWTMWWLTIGTTYLALAQRLGRTGIAAFYCGHILADIGWYCVVAFLVTAGVPFLSGNIYRGMMVSLGFVLGGIGIYFLVAGIRSLRTGSD
ncbi:MAG: LysE family translocator, partial [Dehalococcoidia bacterium]|nr:LysE family translocator [Dehalococcoidia bacterium]